MLSEFSEDFLLELKKVYIKIEYPPPLPKLSFNKKSFGDIKHGVEFAKDFKKLTAWLEYPRFYDIFDSNHEARRTWSSDLFHKHPDEMILFYEKYLGKDKFRANIFMAPDGAITILKMCLAGSVKHKKISDHLSHISKKLFANSHADNYKKTVKLREKGVRENELTVYRLLVALLLYSWSPILLNHCCISIVYWIHRLFSIFMKKKSSYHFA